MTSKIVVNNIEADAGISTVTFASEVTASTFNGNIVGTAATFSGNVDIAGALTYEDVTNVDSVGIVTARSGIHVTGGSVGIGTDNPSAPLHLSGPDATSAKIKIEDNNNGIAASEINVANGGRDLRIAAPQDIYFQDVDTGEKHLYIESGGNIGIGTDNPTSALEIRTTTTNSTTHYRNNASNGGAYFGVRATDLGAASAGEAYIYSYNSGINLLADGTGDINFATGGTGSKVRITSEGKIGINQTSPSEKLEVYAGDILLSSNANGVSGGVGPDSALKFEYNGHQYAKIVGNGRDSSGYGDIDFYTSSSAGVTNLTQRMTIRADGKIGIGNSSPATNLDVNGSLQLRASSGSGGHTTYATRIYSRLDSTHCSVIESYVNSSTAFEMMGTYADNAGANPRVVIAAGGQNVGINTTNPTQSLYVNGTTRLGGGVDYGSTTILNIAPGVVKWDTAGNSGGRLNADNNGNWYLNGKSYPVYDSLGVNMNDIYGANTGAGNIGGWLLLGNTQDGAPYPRKAYKISAPNSTQGTFAYQVWFNGDANYIHGGLYVIRINNWSESTRFTSVTITCINGDSDGLRVYAYNDANGIWITTDSIWGSLYIRKFGYDDGARSRGSSLCAVDNGGYLAVGDVNGIIGTIPSGYTEVHANDSGGGGYNIEGNSRFQAGQGGP